MSAAIKYPVVTAEQFEQIENHARFDLICGELYPMPPMPGEEHGDITNVFTVLVGSYVLEHKLGKCFAAETRFIIARNPDTVIGPDWAFVIKGRLPSQRRKGFVPLVPDAVLEVRSPSDSKREAATKVETWLTAGVRVALELNPASQVLTVHRPDVTPLALGIEDTLTLPDLLPGFTLPIRLLFEEPESDDEA